MDDNAPQQLDDTAPAMEELAANQRVLDYDTKEFTIELLVQKFGDGGEDDDIFVPAYQRAFSWGTRRQSRFVESLLVGLPVPYLFFGDIEDGRLEVVDGLQRLSTCVAFLKGQLELEGLDRLELLNGATYTMLSKSQQRRFRNRTMRSVVLSQKANEEDRRDMFGRINTGSLVAEPVEARYGSQPGPIADLIDELVEDAMFQQLCPITEGAKKKREGVELLTRLFAFTDGIDQDYDDRIGKYLNRWLKARNEESQTDESVAERYRTRFFQVMEFVEKNFPYGFKKKSTARSTPRVRFDAIAVGVWLAIETNPEVRRGELEISVDDWLNSDSFFLLTRSSAANTRRRLLSRWEYVKQMLLGNRPLAEAAVPGKE